MGRHSATSTMKLIPEGERQLDCSLRMRRAGLLPILPRFRSIGAVAYHRDMPRRKASVAGGQLATGVKSVTWSYDPPIQAERGAGV